MYILNIGLNNNPLDAVSIVGFHLVRHDLVQWQVENGEYDGQVEPTLVASVNRLSYSDVVNLCMVLNQECIAVYDDVTETGKLIYSPSFRGEKYDFNPEYFLDPNNE